MKDCSKNTIRGDVNVWITLMEHITELRNDVKDLKTRVDKLEKEKWIVYNKEGE